MGREILETAAAVHQCDEGASGLLVKLVDSFQQRLAGSPCRELALLTAEVADMLPCLGRPDPLVQLLIDLGSDLQFFHRLQDILLPDKTRCPDSGFQGAMCEVGNTQRSRRRHLQKLINGFRESLKAGVKAFHRAEYFER